jgi:hypothetical protein
MEVLEAEELSHCLLGIARLNAAKSLGGDLQGGRSKGIGGADDRWQSIGSGFGDRSLGFFLPGLLHSEDSPLLLLPLGAVLTLGALVLLGENLLNADNGDGLGWSNDVGVSSSSPGTRSINNDVGLLRASSALDGSGASGVSGRSPGKWGFEGDHAAVSELLDGAHDSVALAKGADVEFLEIFELEIDQDAAGDVVDEELLNHGRLKAGLGHPVSDLAGCPVANLRCIEFGNGVVESVDGLCGSLGFGNGRHVEKDIIFRVGEDVGSAAEEVRALRTYDRCVIKMKLEAVEATSVRRRR